jgi:hypothetical protein
MWKSVRQPLRRLAAEYLELTGPLRGLPAALLIGAQKSGTTSLFHYLVEHPDVLPSFGKEIHYFDLHYARGVGWYRGRFPFRHRLRRGALTLDATPYYLAHPLAPQRASQLLPNAKLVAVLRNPINRAFSHYHHEVRAGQETLSFAEAIEKESERLTGEEERLSTDPGYYSYNHHHYSYTGRGLYLDQLRRWVQHFPRSRLLVLQSERFFRDPAATTAAVHEFLGLRPFRGRSRKIFLPGKYGHEMPPDVRKRLATYFEPYNRELYQWLGEEFDWT